MTALIDKILPDFQSLTVTRTGGYAGERESMHIDNELGTTIVRGWDDNDQHKFDLDARDAEDLLHAASKLATSKPGASGQTGSDMYEYDIELRWNGQSYRVTSVDLGADEALHGIMLVASRLFDERAVAGITARSVPHDDGIAGVEIPGVNNIVPITDEKPIPAPTPVDPGEGVYPIPGVTTDT